MPRGRKRQRKEDSSDADHLPNVGDAFTPSTGPALAAPVPSQWEVTPWDQHAGILRMARFDYSSEGLLRSGTDGSVSLQGFLITCPFRESNVPAE